MNVLAVDDDPVARLMLELTLSQLGHKVVTAGDGNEAWEHFAGNDIQVVVSDWVMPVSDGLDLCRRIRHLGDSYVYFILVSSQLDNPEKQLEAVHCGVDDLAIKPLMPADLKARMRVAERVYRITHRLQRRGVWENLRETRSMSEGDAKQDNLSLHACKYCGLHSRSVGRMLRAFCPHCRKRALMQKIFDCRADQSLGWNQSLRYG